MYSEWKEREARKKESLDQGSEIIVDSIPKINERSRNLKTDQKVGGRLYQKGKEYDPNPNPN